MSFLRFPALRIMIPMKKAIERAKREALKAAIWRNEPKFCEVPEVEYEYLLFAIEKSIDPQLHDDFH